MVCSINRHFICAIQGNAHHGERGLSEAPVKKSSFRDHQEASLVIFFLKPVIDYISPNKANSLPLFLSCFVTHKESISLSRINGTLQGRPVVFHYAFRSGMIGLYFFFQYNSMREHAFIPFLFSEQKDQQCAIHFKIPSDNLWVPRLKEMRLQFGQRSQNQWLS